MTSKIVISECGRLPTLNQKLSNGLSAKTRVVPVVYNDQGIFVSNGVLFRNTGSALVSFFSFSPPPGFRIYLPISFMTFAVRTSGHVYDDFLCFLFLHDHREASPLIGEFS